MADAYVDRFERVLSAHVISTYRFSKRRRHRVVVVAHAGRNNTVTFPATGSDSRRGVRNCEADLRRALGGAPR
jgi:hypothetical protein